MQDRIAHLEARLHTVSRFIKWSIIVGVINILLKLLLPFGLYPPPS